MLRSLWMLLIAEVVSFQAPTTPTERRSCEMMAKSTRKERRQRYPKAGMLNFVLTKDVAPWGKEGDVLRVTRGFALNYLGPKRLAVPASPQVIAEYEKKKVLEEAERLKKIEAATVSAAKLRETGTFTIQRRAGDEGKIFGSVLATDLLQVVKAVIGTDDVKIILPPKGIDAIGFYTFTVQLHPEVETECQLSIVKVED